MEPGHQGHPLHTSSPTLATHLHKVGVFGVAHRHYRMHLLNQLLLLVVIKVHVPFGQPRLARPVLDEDEPDLCRRGNPELRGCLCMDRVRIEWTRSTTNGPKKLQTLKKKIWGAHSPDGVILRVNVYSATSKYHVHLHIRVNRQKYMPYNHNMWVHKIRN